MTINKIKEKIKSRLRDIKDLKNNYPGECCHVLNGEKDGLEWVFDGLEVFVYIL